MRAHMAAHVGRAAHGWQGRARAPEQRAGPGRRAWRARAGAPHLLQFAQLVLHGRVEQRGLHLEVVLQQLAVRGARLDGRLRKAMRAGVRVRGRCARAKLRGAGAGMRAYVRACACEGGKRRPACLPPPRALPAAAAPVRCWWCCCGGGGNACTTHHARTRAFVSSLPLPSSAARSRRRDCWRVVRSCQEEARGCSRPQEEAWWEARGCLKLLWPPQTAGCASECIVGRGSVRRNWGGNGCGCVRVCGSHGN